MEMLIVNKLERCPTDLILEACLGILSDLYECWRLQYSYRFYSSPKSCGNNNLDQTELVLRQTIHELCTRSNYREY